MTDEGPTLEDSLWGRLGQSDRIDLNGLASQYGAVYAAASLMRRTFVGASSGCGSTSDSDALSGSLSDASPIDRASAERAATGLREAARAVVEWAQYYPTTGNASVPAGFMRALESTLNDEDQRTRRDVAHARRETWHRGPHGSCKRKGEHTHA